MQNQPHCRFTNTLAALKECYEEMDSEELSPAEQAARKKLIRECANLAADYEDELEEKSDQWDQLSLHGTAGITRRRSR